MKLIGFRSFDWLNSSYRCGIPKDAKPYLTISPQVLARAGSNPTFGPSQIGERTIPAEFTYQGGVLSYEDAWNELLVRLNVYNTAPGQLRAQRLDGTIVAINAVLTMPNAGSFFGIDDVTSLPVIFVAVDPFWIALTETTASKTFTSGLDMAMPIPIVTALADEPILTVQPTVQRAAPTSAAGWKYRRTYRIANNTGRPLVNYLYGLDIGATDALVTGSKALASGNDLRVIRDGKEVARTLNTWNSATSAIVWFTIPQLDIGATADYDIWYGNASAGAPPTPSGAATPSTDLATTGAGRSTLAVRKWLVDDVLANAGKGGWYINDDDAVPSFVSTDAPGSWRWITTIESPDDFYQDRYTAYVATGTKYRAVFSARRGRSATLPANAEYVRNDGVMFYDPCGISQVRADLDWYNEYTNGTTGNPIGKVVLLSSTDGRAWQAIQTWNTVQATLATIAAANYAIPGNPPYVAFAVQPFNGQRIPTTATTDREVFAAWSSVLEVTVNSALIPATLVQAEEEVYEIAMEVRLGGDEALNPPYRALRIGGASDRRFAVRLNEKIRFDLGDRVATVWNAAGDTKVADASVNAIRAVERLSAGAVESVASLWLGVQPYLNPLPNPSFAVDLAGWSRQATAAGVTANAQLRDTATFKTTPASLKTQITASTAGSGVDAVQEIATTYIPIGGRSRITVAAEQRTDNVNLQPALTIWFYDAAQTLISSSRAADWTPVINTWFRRVHSAAVPANAAYYRVGTTVRTKSANQTGSNWLDDIAPNGLDLIVVDAAIGTLVVTAGWLGQFL